MHLLRESMVLKALTITSKIWNEINQGHHRKRVKYATVFRDLNLLSLKLTEKHTQTIRKSVEDFNNIIEQLDLVGICGILYLADLDFAFLIKVRIFTYNISKVSSII